MTLSGESDRAVLSQMLTRAGIVWHDEPRPNEDQLVVEAKAGPKNVGYSGFLTCFYFDQEGKLEQMGAWE